MLKTSRSRDETSVQFLKGIGPRRAKALERLGYKTLRELFYLFPKRYEDRSHFKAISELKEGEVVSIRGRIVSCAVRYFSGRGNFQMSVTDGTGVVSCTWFNQPYMKRAFQKDEEVILFGKTSRFGRIQLQNPEYEKIGEDGDELIHSGRITPIYPLVSGLYQRSLRRSLWKLVDEHQDLLEDYLPEEIQEERGFAGLQEAMREIHFPTSLEKREEARQRLVFDEFFLFEINLLSRIYKMQKNQTAYSITGCRTITQQFCSRLPFELTDGQKKAIEDIQSDLEQKVPMARLLQGDVGSGKTIVAAACFQGVIQSGFQVALLAPTETLAEQHFLTLRQYFDGKVVLLTGSVSEAEKKEIRQGLSSGTISLVIGTHALLEDSISFKHLALVVIDEQHKFGVRQRAKLLLKERRPHVLFMTATPIPRTLALTLYGDLRSTVIAELPKGRRPIQTQWLLKKDESTVIKKIREHLSNQEQGYYLYPAIEVNEKSRRISCEADFPRISKLFPGYKTALIHGRLKTEERAKLMKEFREGKIHILVTTTVIEVGIDNPNATFMVVQGAEYFGLSQLHQIRGRIGRGNRPSSCFLIGEPETDEAKIRFDVMTKTQDGFQISEEDLKLRGPGDFLGTRQSGMPLFRLANIISDQSILEEARQCAHAVLDQDSELSDEKYQKLKQELIRYGNQFSD